MVDTFRPLELGAAGLDCEDENYAWSWSGEDPLTECCPLGVFTIDGERSEPRLLGASGTERLSSRRLRRFSGRGLNEANLGSPAECRAECLARGVSEHVRR